VYFRPTPRIATRSGCAVAHLCRLLADYLKVPLSAVRIVAGEKSRTKRVAVSGVTREQVLALLQPQASRKTKD
jgi:uncharacterized protein YggU (UPF0235/DUF167 family)